MSRIPLSEVLASASGTSVGLAPGWGVTQICSDCGGSEILSTRDDADKCPCSWQSSVVAENIRKYLEGQGYKREEEEEEDEKSTSVLNIAGDWKPSSGQGPTLTVLWRRAQDPHSSSLRNKVVRNWLGELQARVPAGEARRVLIVHRKRRVPVAELMASQEAERGWRIEYWDEDAFLYPPGIRGGYFFEHETLPEEEIKRVEAVFQVKREGLPVIFSADPGAKWWGVRPGNVVRIRSTLGGGKQYIYKRCEYLAEERFRKESIVPKKPYAPDREDRLLH